MKTEKKRLVKDIEALCRKIIYIRDKGKCQKCGKPVSGKNAHTSHVIPKSHGNYLRFDITNLKLLCFHCHINWWHKNPLESAEWFKSKFPERWEYLQLNKEKTIKMTLDDYDKLKTAMQNMVYEMVERRGNDTQGISN